jgi:hypothetical protein
MNPTVPEKVVQDAYERDAASAAAEFGAEFRTDIAGFLDRGIVDAAIDSGVQVRPPIEGVRYIAFADPSGGARDAFTVGIAHAENGTAVLDAVFERRPPFNPATVVAEIRDFLRSYRISSVVGDRYGAAWVTTAFAQVGVRYTHSRRDRSAIYLDALPLFTSGRVRLIDNPRLAAQLASLERRTSPGGRDRVDHGPGGHDDLANAAAGAITLATAPSQTAPIVEPIIVRIDTVDRWSNDDAAMTYSHYMASIGR